MESTNGALPWKNALTCCDSFKGTLTACDAGLAIERAFRRAETARGVSNNNSLNNYSSNSSAVNVMHCPMSDGGAGLLESLFFQPPADANGVQAPPLFTRVNVPPNCVIGPLGKPLLSAEAENVCVACDVANRVAVVEMAAASGLPMLPEKLKNPLHTTSYGVGQLIQFAMEYIARETHDPNCGVTVYLGIGGSATNDGGLGALQALGVELLVSENANNSDSPQPLRRPFVGGDLPKLVGIRISERCRAMFFHNSEKQKDTCGPYCKELRLICDVASPLVGPHGATAIFGPQKCNSGWSSAERQRVLSILEKGMSNAAAAVVRSVEKNILYKNNNNNNATTRYENNSSALAALCDTPGGGGAGGMSGFFRFVLKATWMPGADAVAQLLGFQEKLRQCQCIVTGEGSFDTQTIRYNKTIGRMMQIIVAENIRSAQQQQQQQQHGGEEENNNNNNNGKLCGVQDVIVVCGRTTYRNSEEVRRVLLSHMMDQQKQDEKGKGAHQAICHATEAELAAATPRIHLLSLTPRNFPVKEALGRAGYCVEEIITKYLSGDTTVATLASRL